MPRPSLSSLLAVTTLALAASTAAVSHAAYQPPTELMGDGGPVIPLKNAAMIQVTEGGYRYIAGQQDSNITVTLEDRTLRIIDTGTAELRTIPAGCRRLSVPQGIAASCTVPTLFHEGNRMFLEIWPRLGDDAVDASGMPAMVRMWVLADAGFDTVRTGDGDDFVNGAHDDDQVSGGSGNDWIRTGSGHDRISGDSGDDKLVAGDGRDTVDGGAGNDRISGGAGPDALHAGSGKDVVACGAGSDTAYVDQSDKWTYCETLPPS